MKKNKFVDNQKTMHASTSNRRLELTDLHLTGAGAILGGWGGSLVFLCGQGLRGEGPWGGATEAGGWGGQGGRFYRRFYLQLRFSQPFDLVHDTCQSTWHDNVTHIPIIFYSLIHIDKKWISIHSIKKNKFYFTNTCLISCLGMLETFFSKETNSFDNILPSRLKNTLKTSGSFCIRISAICMAPTTTFTSLDAIIAAMWL